MTDTRRTWLTRDLARRSVEVILDGQAPSGAFIASPTFEQYRFSWLRDGAFITEALNLVGQQAAAARFHDWIAALVEDGSAGMERAVAAARAGQPIAPADYLHCRYDVDGRPGPDDWPTFQLDGPGIWLWSLAHHARHGGTLSPAHREAAGRVARYLGAVWRLPSYDAWEEWPDHLHTSTLAAILAGLCAAEALGVEAGPDREANRVARSAIEERLTPAPGQALTKWPGSDAVDGSLLWLVAPYEILAPEEAPFAATLAGIERDLVSRDGGVHRYRADTYYGGGEWLLLTAALGRVYLRRDRQGDRARASACLSWLERQASDEGDLPEQIGTNALHPETIDEWRARWGESASPLLWSHAAYLALAHELGRLTA
jgi:GH15 family glucan-1,4-alpha-glucosidase